MRTRSLALAGALGAALTAAGAALPADSIAAATTLCVDSKPGCYTTLQAALDRSRDGDTIRLGRGRFGGGATIRTTVKIEGAGAKATTIAGGGPVLTIGGGAATEPTVRIRGVTITGGITHGDGVLAFGGGISVPPAAGGAPGATVTIEDSVITGNRAEPTSTSDSPSGAPCPGGDCPFALAWGGGISNTGAMTLRRVVVSDNTAGGVASDADGGGIASSNGSLTLQHVVVADNHAVAAVPNGRFAEGGGVFVQSGALSITDSVVTRNSTELTSTLPYFLPDGETIDMASHSGGVHVGADGPTTIARTAITRNTVAVTNLEGEALAFASGLLVLTSPFELRDSVVSGNRVVATVGSSADVGFSGTAVELDAGGTITGTRIVGNTADVSSPAGDAAAGNGLAVYTFEGEPQPALVRHSVIAGNTATASSPAGAASVLGVGVLNNSLLTLDHVLVRDNAGTATGLTGVAQGGGIWNGVLLSGPPVELTLRSTTVTHNSVAGGPGITASGGGIFTTEPVALFDTRIAHNAPDQCTGC